VLARVALVVFNNSTTINQLAVGVCYFYRVTAVESSLPELQRTSGSPSDQPITYAAARIQFKIVQSCQRPDSELLESLSGGTACRCAATPRLRRRLRRPGKLPQSLQVVVPFQRPQFPPAGDRPLPYKQQYATDHD
jgi:hypothetical protein